MSLRINNQAPTYMAAHNLQKVMKDMNSVQERLTTGLKINKASDGPASLVIGKKFESQLAGIAQARKNVETAVNLMDTADKTLGTVEGLLIKAKTLALDSMDGTKSAAQRTANDQELDEILSSIDRISGNTKFGEVSLLDGTFSSKSFQVGDTAGATVSVSLNDMRTTALNIKHGTESGEINISSATTATSALSAIETALNSVTAERGRIGGITANTFKPTLENLNIQFENIESARSTVMDADYEKDTAEFQKLNVRLQVASFLLGSTAQQNSLVLNLLG
jgi:flagellin